VKPKAAGTVPGLGALGPFTDFVRSVGNGTAEDLTQRAQRNSGGRGDFEARSINSCGAKERTQKSFASLRACGEIAVGGGAWRQVSIWRGGAVGRCFFLYVVPLLPPLFGLFGCRRDPFIVLFQQHHAKMHQVTGQRAPQRHASRFVQPAYCKLRQPAVTSQVRIDCFAGGRSLLVNLLPFVTAHALLPSSHRCVVA
jgi:hypothetical protein